MRDTRPRTSFSSRKTETSPPGREKKQLDVLRSRFTVNGVRRRVSRASLRRRRRDELSRHRSSSHLLPPRRSSLPVARPVVRTRERRARTSMPNAASTTIARRRRRSSSFFSSLSPLTVTRLSASFDPFERPRGRTTKQRETRAHARTRDISTDCAGRSAPPSGRCRAGRLH